MVALLGLFKKSLQAVFLMKLTQNPPKVPGWNRKDAKRKRISSINDSNHREIQVSYTPMIIIASERDPFPLNFFYFLQVQQGSFS